MDFQPITKGYYLEALSIDGDVVWFSDVIGGGVRRLQPDGRIDTWFPNKRWIGCIVLNDDGCVISSGAGGIAWFDPATGASGMLLDKLDGKPLPGANEMTPLPNGGLVFGTCDIPAIERGERTAPAGLYRLDTDGRVTELCHGLKFCNGIGLSADDRRLFHNETQVGTAAYDILSDGRLGKPTRLVDKADVDGMAMDEKGRMWIAGFRSDEILCMHTDGKIDERIALPAGGLTNIRFGGADMRDLYLTTVPSDAGEKLARGDLPTAQTSVLYRTRATIAGRPVPRTRFRLR